MFVEGLEVLGRSVLTIMITIDMFGEVFGRPSETPSGSRSLEQHYSDSNLLKDFQRKEALKINKKKQINK